MQPLHHSAPGPGMDSKAHLSGAPADYSSLAAQRPTAGPVKAEAPVQPNGHSHLPAYLQMQATQVHKLHTTTLPAPLAMLCRPDRAYSFCMQPKPALRMTSQGVLLR